MPLDHERVAQAPGPTRPSRDEAPKHTPGPWRVTELSSGWEIEGSDGGYGSTVCVSNCDPHDGSTYNPRPTTEADARLIAAAPDLLAAAKAQHDAIDGLFALLAQVTREHKAVEPFMPSKSAAWPALVQGNAAIAKAESRS